MYVGRALYLKGCGAHLIVAVWSGILSLNTVSQQNNSCCCLKNIIKSATCLSVSGRDYCLYLCCCYFYLWLWFPVTVDFV